MSELPGGIDGGVVTADTGFVGGFKLTYSNVVATLALFIALGGTTFAATQFHGKQIKKGTVTGKQIRKGSVPGGDLRPNSVTGRQVREAKLGQVPQANLANQARLATLANRATTADVAALANNAEQLGGASAGSYLDRCESGTTGYAGVCIELEFRTAATWPAAARICGDAGGRLPALEELEGFRQQPGINLSPTGEHTSAYIDINGLSDGGERTIGIRDGGTLSAGYIYGTSSASFRCVKPVTNR